MPLSAEAKQDIVERMLKREATREKVTAIATEHGITRAYAHRLVREDRGRAGVVPQEIRARLLRLESRLIELTNELDRTADEVSGIISEIDPAPTD